MLPAANRPEAVVADQGYDADWLIAHIEVLGADVVISSKRNRTEQRTYNQNLYADRNKVERSSAGSSTTGESRCATKRR
jgi:transposase